MPTVINPTKVKWTLSPDHDAVSFAGPLVTSYRLEIVGTGAPPPTDLGKPSVGEASLPPRSAFTATGPFVASIVTKGSGGETPSQGSDPFGYVDPPKAAGVPTLE